MKKTKYALAALVALALLTPSCKKKDNDGDNLPTTKIGALLSLTGNWSSLGITSRAAIDVAIEEVNISMNDRGLPNRFSSVVYDTKLEATLAGKYIADAKTAGCQFVLGPQSSAEAGAVREYAGSNNVLVVSQGSTAGSLSIEGDNLFRFCPADNIEGVAMAKTIYNQGIRAIVTAARDDAGNKGLQTATGNAFVALGGKSAVVAPYSSTASSPSNFVGLVSEIRNRVAEHMMTYQANEVAVYLASFDECVAIFQEAAGDPILSGVRWYGGDGTALSAALIGNAPAADFAIATHYFAPGFGLPASSQTWNAVISKIELRAGMKPDAFALATYDAVWVIAKSYMALPANPDANALKAEFVKQAELHNGITGNTKLNAAGDRASGAYDYWGIEKQNGSYKWVLVGRSE